MRFAVALLASVIVEWWATVQRVIFALGFFGAAFSSMIAHATAGGTLLADGLGYGNRLSAPRVRIGILGVLAFGAAVTARAGSAPVQLIIVAQALTVVVAPLLGVLLWCWPTTSGSWATCATGRGRTRMGRS